VAEIMQTLQKPRRLASERRTGVLQPGLPTVVLWAALMSVITTPASNIFRSDPSRIPSQPTAHPPTPH